MKISKIAFGVIFFALFAFAACQNSDQVNTTYPDDAIGYINDEGLPDIIESQEFVINRLSDKFGLKNTGSIIEGSLSIEYNKETKVGYLYFKNETENGSSNSAIRVQQVNGFMLPIAEQHSCAGSPCENCNFTYKRDGSIDGCDCGDTSAAGSPTGFCNHTVSSGGFH